MGRSVTEPSLDPTAWVDTHGDYLLRFALIRVRNRHLAEELVQDALLAALAARRNFRGQCSERSWLTAILKRKVIDWLRVEVRQRASQELLPDKWVESRFTRSGKWKRKPEEWSEDDPGQALIREDFRATLANCLDRLPSRLRQAFVLRHVDERSTDEVCEATKSSAPNLWVMLHRARLRLWRCLTVNWYGDAVERASEGDVS